MTGCILTPRLLPNCNKNRTELNNSLRMLNADLSAKAGKNMSPACLMIGLNPDLRTDANRLRRFSFEIFFDPRMGLRTGIDARKIL